MASSFHYRAPARSTVAAALGLAWSVFGLFQFWSSEMASEAQLVAAGMSRDQAALYLALPGWMAVAFAVGVGGGVAGSALLLARSRLAVPVLLASLAGYVLLFIGDWTQGVFAAFGVSQLAILLFVVLVAAALCVLALRLSRAERLR